MQLNCALWLQQIRGNFCLADYLVFGCLWNGGLFAGYYVKHAYVYSNLWQHWHAACGALAICTLAIAWTLRKRQQQQYSYDHYYIILYGLLCALLGSCFLLSHQLAISFYFSAIGSGVLTLASYSYISLRSSGSGLRPARIALGNTAFAVGQCTGFMIFNEFEPHNSGYIAIAITILLIIGVCINELLQHLGIYNYKQSADLAFNLLNEERLVFLPKRSVYAQFVNRTDYHIANRSYQWSILIFGGGVVLLQRCCCCCLLSPAYMELMWSSTESYINNQNDNHLYVPFALYAAGCAFGSLLLLRYTPKLVYLLFGIIQVTLVVALLCIYDDAHSENCFLFLCLIYSTTAVLSSHALHCLLECAPFLYTELIFAIAFTIELGVTEGMKYQAHIDELWLAILISSVIMMLLTILSALLMQLLLPPSASLVDVRNYLLGVRKMQPLTIGGTDDRTQTQFWHTNQFLAHNKQPHELRQVNISKTRKFHQYPANTDDSYDTKSHS